MRRSPSRPPEPAQPKAPWMVPGAPRIAKPSWLRLAAAAEPAPEPAPTPVAVPVDVTPSVPPPRSVRQPSIPPPPSRRMPPAQIQTTRELELESEVVQLHDELQRVIADSESMRARVMEESEPAIVALALAIAKRVVGRELQADPTLLHGWVREARGLLPKGSVHMASDVSGVDDGQVDPTLPAGTAEVRDGASVIAVGADARIAAMADALGVDP